jgi:hypothetical protein
MMNFLINIVEQMDLAREHVAKGDINNVRFGLMLIDNAVEITLHQIAKDKQREPKSFLQSDKANERSSALEAALGQHFGSKVKFADSIGMLPEGVSESIGIFHAFRNEVYHIGIQHEAVLPGVAAFYYKVACNFLAGYAPRWIGYNPDMELPERARKFFGNERFHIHGIEKYQAACRELGEALPFSPAEIARILADHVDDVIKLQDTAIHMIATAGPRKHSRDEAVVETFAWSVAFTEEGKKFALEREFKGSMADYIEWLGKNYPLPLKKDPIPVWKARAAGIRAESNPHKALKKYRDFMKQTSDAHERRWKSRLARSSSTSKNRSNECACAGNELWSLCRSTSSERPYRLLARPEFRSRQSPADIAQVEMCVAQRQRSFRQVRQFARDPMQQNREFGLGETA